MLKKALLLASAMALLGPAAGGALAQDEKILNIYNWSDYIAEDTISNFEKETGIEVRYDTFDSNEILEAKLLSGNSGYDLVVPSGSFLERQIQAGVFQKLQKDKLTNYGNLDSAIMEAVANHDAGNEHAVPYMWGTTGFGYNVQKIAERMPDAPVDSWDMLFKPEIVSKFADCGVSMLDAPSEAAAAALQYLGKDPNSEKSDDLKAAKALLESVRPYIKYFHSSQYLNDLASGEVCLAMGWSGDVAIAQARAEETEQDFEIAYTIPKEGALMWFDMLAVPADAPHPENAHLFIDYILRPQVVADISNYVYYANPNAAATELVDAEVTGDPGIYPSEETKSMLFTAKAHSPKFDRKLNRAWTSVKTGQ